MTLPTTELPPWHSTLTRQILSACSVRNLIVHAPNAIILAEVWKLILLELHAGRMTPNNGTLRRWTEDMGKRTVELMQDDPRQAPFVYSTLFTFFGAEARDALETELNRIIKDVPYNPSQP